MTISMHILVLQTMLLKMSARRSFLVLFGFILLYLTIEPAIAVEVQKSSSIKSKADWSVSDRETFVRELDMLSKKDFAKWISTAKSQNSFVNAFGFNLKNSDHSQYRTIYERNDFYFLAADGIENLVDVEASKSRFFHAAAVVTLTRSIGPIDGASVFKSAASLVLQETGDTFELLRQINAKLFAENFHIVKAFIESGKIPSVPGAPKSSGAFEFDLSMVNFEQETVQKVLLQKKVQANVFNAIDCHDVLSSIALTNQSPVGLLGVASEWAKKAGYGERNFSNLKWRKAIGFAVVHMMHKKSFEQFRASAIARIGALSGPIPKCSVANANIRATLNSSIVVYSDSTGVRDLVMRAAAMELLKAKDSGAIAQVTKDFSDILATTFRSSKGEQFASITSDAARKYRLDKMISAPNLPSKAKELGIFSLNPLLGNGVMSSGLKPRIDSAIARLDWLGVLQTQLGTHMRKILADGSKIDMEQSLSGQSLAETIGGNAKGDFLDLMIRIGAEQDQQTYLRQVTSGFQKSINDRITSEVGKVGKTAHAIQSSYDFFNVASNTEWSSLSGLGFAKESNATLKSAQAIARLLGNTELAKEISEASNFVSSGIQIYEAAVLLSTGGGAVFAVTALGKLGGGLEGMTSADNSGKQLAAAIAQLLDYMQREFANINNKLDYIIEELAAIKRDIEALKTDVAIVRSKVEAIQVVLSLLQAQLDRIEIHLTKKDIIEPIRFCAVAHSIGVKFPSGDAKLGDCLFRLLNLGNEALAVEVSADTNWDDPAEIDAFGRRFNAKRGVSDVIVLSDSRRSLISLEKKLAPELFSDLGSSPSGFVDLPMLALAIDGLSNFNDNYLYALPWTKYSVSEVKAILAKLDFLMKDQENTANSQDTRSILLDKIFGKTPNDYDFPCSVGGCLGGYRVALSRLSDWMAEIKNRSISRVIDQYLSLPTLPLLFSNNCSGWSNGYQDQFDNFNLGEGWTTLIARPKTPFWSVPIRMPSEPGEAQFQYAPVKFFRPNALLSPNPSWLQWPEPFWIGFDDLDLARKDLTYSRPADFLRGYVPRVCLTGQPDRYSYKGSAAPGNPETYSLELKVQFLEAQYLQGSPPHFVQSLNSPFQYSVSLGTFDRQWATAPGLRARTEADLRQFVSRLTESQISKSDLRNALSQNLLEFVHYAAQGDRAVLLNSPSLVGKAGWTSHRLEADIEGVGSVYDVRFLFLEAFQKEMRAAIADDSFKVIRRDIDLYSGLLRGFFAAHAPRILEENSVIETLLFGPDDQRIFDSSILVNVSACLDQWVSSGSDKDCGRASLLIEELFLEDHELILRLRYFAMKESIERIDWKKSGSPSLGFGLLRGKLKDLVRTLPEF
jgi:hypothetical protein